MLRNTPPVLFLATLLMEPRSKHGNAAPGRGLGNTGVPCEDFKEVRSPGAARGATSELLFALLLLERAPVFRAGLGGRVLR